MRCESLWRWDTGDARMQFPRNLLGTSTRLIPTDMHRDPCICRLPLDNQDAPLSWDSDGTRMIHRKNLHRTDIRVASHNLFCAPNILVC